MAAKKKTPTNDISSLLDVDVDTLLADAEEAESIDNLLGQTTEELTEAAPEPSSASMSFAPEETEEVEKKMPEESVDASTATEIVAGVEIVFHVVSDYLQLGFERLPCGTVVKITPNTGKWHWTLDRAGKSWVRLLNDPEGQIEYWGEVRIKPGLPTDTRLMTVTVPEFVPEELHEQWRQSVLDALDTINQD